MHYRVVGDGAKIGTYHGQVYIVETLTKKGRTSTWEFTAAFLQLADAVTYKQSCEERLTA